MIYLKRGKWCFRDEDGILHKFNSEIAAKIAVGSAPQTEIEDAPEEEIDSEETTGPNEQEVVFESESGSEETF